MPIFKFGALGDYIAGMGTLAVPAPVFLAQGAVVGLDGDVEITVPASVFLALGEGGILFGVPSPSIRCRGNETAECNLLITIPTLQADGHVAIEGVIAFSVARVCLAGVGESTASFSVPAPRFAAAGDVQLRGDGTFSVPAPVFAGDVIVSSHGDGLLKITLPRFLATGGAAAASGEATLLVPSLYFTGEGAVYVEPSLVDETDVILKFERRRRLI